MAEEAQSAMQQDERSGSNWITKRFVAWTALIGAAGTLIVTIGAIIDDVSAVYKKEVPVICELNIAIPWCDEYELPQDVKAVFMNVVRSSEHRPLDFSAWPWLKEKGAFSSMLNDEIDEKSTGVFRANNIPNEIVLLLIISHIIETSNGVSRVIFNDYKNPEFPLFRQLINLFSEYGVTFSNNPINRNQNVNDSKSNKVLFCISPLIMSPDAPHAGVKPSCDTDSPSQTVSFLSRNGDVVKLSMKIRTIPEIMNFLGNIIDANDDRQIEMTAPETVAWGGPYLAFNIKKNLNRAKCYFYVRDDRGSFCLPIEYSDNAIRILETVSQIVEITNK